MSTTGRGLRDRGAAQTAHSMIAELAKRMDNVLRVGRVFDTDYVNGKIRVRIGKLGESPIETDWLPWVTGRSGGTTTGDRTWAAPEKGDLVVVCSPSGVMEQAFVSGAIPCKDSYHAGDSPDIARTVFRDIGWGVESFYRTGPSRDWFLGPSGTFFWRVGSATSIVADQQHIELRVGTTKLRITEDGIRMHVSGQAAELLVTPAQITAHVASTGVVDITAQKVEAAVGGTARVAVTATDVTMAVVGAVEARLASDQSFRAKVAGALLELMPDLLHLNSNGADVSMSGESYTLKAASYDAVNSTVSGPAAVGGAALIPVTPAPATTKEAPVIQDGNKPAYPA